MKGFTRGVVFYIVFKFHLCIAKHEPVNFNVAEGSVQIPCETDQECKEMEFKGFKCVDNVCICEDKMKCEKSKLKATVTKIGQNCTDSFQCNMEHSFCNVNGTCDCIENTVNTKDKRKCLKVTKEIGLPCEEDVQCSLLNSICVEKECRCSSDMHVENGICSNITGLGSACQRNEECPDFSKCKNGVCTCSKKYIQSNDTSKCLLKAKEISSPCSEDIQCSSALGSGSVCSNGVCMCMELFHFKASINKCVMDLLLGEFCSHHDDCHQPGGEESRLECYLGVCKCKSPYYETEGYCLSSKNGAHSAIPNVLPFIVSYVIFYVIV